MSKKGENLNLRGRHYYRNGFTVTESCSVILKLWMYSLGVLSPTDPYRKNLYISPGVQETNVCEKYNEHNTNKWNVLRKVLFNKFDFEDYKKVIVKIKNYKNIII